MLVFCCLSFSLLYPPPLSLFLALILFSLLSSALHFNCILVRGSFCMLKPTARPLIATRETMMGDVARGAVERKGNKGGRGNHHRRRRLRPGSNLVHGSSRERGKPRLPAVRYRQFSQSYPFRRIFLPRSSSALSLFPLLSPYHPIFQPSSTLGVAVSEAMQCVPLHAKIIMQNEWDENFVFENRKSSRNISQAINKISLTQK